MAKPKIKDIEQVESPCHYADRIGLEYSKTVSQENKKGKGQFFTPTKIAYLMASLSERTSKSSIRILDPGCGTCILSSALIETLIANKSKIKEIELIAYETDEDLIPYTKKAINYLKNWLSGKGITLHFQLKSEDFILANAGWISGKDDGFDFVISNPPYFKLSKDDKRAIVAKSVVSGQTNIYSIFMAFAAKMLNPNGQLIFITPRSFSSGSYFKAFREYFFNAVQLEKIHLFVSRKDTFNRDAVLQETVILKASNTGSIDPQGEAIISSSHGLKDIETPATKRLLLSDIINLDSQEKILHLPINDNEEGIVNIFKNWSGNLNSYNIQVSTGPVVSFRSTKYIQDHYQNGIVFLAPLFWLHNVNKMSLNWPIVKEGKGQYIRIQDESKSILIPNKNYILLRRFSTKDDKSRLIAAPYFCNYMKADFIGVENKVNYIYRPKGHLNRNEVVGLCALLNSELFDNYFRIFNGNVNVSATELREMPLPPLETLKEIGDQLILANDYTVETVNKIINETFELEGALNLV
ncbi:MAG: Eco57I restriction-modification methylase domain-containing protein [bacterium]|nr:Eco57I restriction-modification methylase domain-containing protein [bacterium]